MVWCEICPGNKKLSKSHEKSRSHQFYKGNKSCNTCPLEFDNYSSLQTHLKYHHNICCKTCLRYFKTKEKYDEHLTTKSHLTKIVMSETLSYIEDITIHDSNI